FAAACRLSRDFEEECRLADAGLAREQDGGARHDTAEDAVELAHPARVPRALGGRNGRDGARATRRGRGRDLGTGRGWHSRLDDRSPLLTLAAAPCPLRGRPPALRT